MSRISRHFALIGVIAAVLVRPAFTADAPKFQIEDTSDRANAKRWYVYSVKVAAKGNGKFRLSEDGASYVNATQNMLLWNPSSKSWSVETRHLRCTGFSKKS